VGPVTVILAMAGLSRQGGHRAIQLVVLVGSVDNFLKPDHSARRILPLTPVLVFVAMLSGIVAFGSTGPSSARLFGVPSRKEVLAMAKDGEWVGRRGPGPNPSIEG